MQRFIGSVGLSAALSLLGCNAILGIHDHELAAGAGGQTSTSGGTAGQSVGGRSSAGRGGTGHGGSNLAGAGAANVTAGSAGTTQPSAGNGGTAGSEPTGGGEAGMGTGETGGMGTGPACGNGKIDGNDECDDGNTKSGDGCSATCQIEPGWTCDMSGCTEICGDGVLVGRELKAGGCDDGNVVPDDGCTNCVVDPSYVCSGAPSECAKTCGDGMLEGSEQCDDGNMMPGDGCYACAVETGFTCDKTKQPTTCEDIDECAAGTDDCDANATCSNTVGSFKCMCNSGYTGSGTTCTDINECATNNGGCDANATCTNKPGTRTCTCNSGYTGSGTTCTDIDECATNNGGCDVNATCTNKPGTRTCTCKSGYTGSGTSCTDVNECATNNGGCSTNATCSNSPGSFTCTCKPGFTGNGTTCVQSSCNGLSNKCGPSANENCCAVGAVTGATFYRSYDKSGNGDMNSPATISNFHFDRFEVTVARFRNFVSAWNGGWRPANGDGKHTHLNGGKGLLDGSAASSGTYETGWNVAWENQVAPTDANLVCDTSATWSKTSGATDNWAVNCVNWFEGYAFCMWDGGFLPSEAEWNYAAAGGTDQRQYPWGTSQINCSFANGYFFSSPCAPGPSAAMGMGGPNAVGSESTTGDGKFGQADLGGNVTEWALDWYNSYPTPCPDCASLTGEYYRMVRGGGWDADTGSVQSGYRNIDNPSNHVRNHGVRCARP
jgi:cysteine-rich repeat protein